MNPFRYRRSRSVTPDRATALSREPDRDRMAATYDLPRAAPVDNQLEVGEPREP